MRIPSLRAAWNTTGDQLIRLVRWVPRPGWRAAFLLLLLAAAGALAVPRLLGDRPAHFYAPGGPGPSARPSRDPVPEHSGDIDRKDPAQQPPYNRAEEAASSPGRAAEPPVTPWGRLIIRRANMDVELADVDRGLSRVAEVVERVGGYVGGTETQTDATGTLRATVTAFVPPDRFASTLTALEGLGRVTARRISGQDVSEEFVDLEARVRNLERHEGQLLSFMGRAQKVADLLSLENELARVRGEIERLAGRIRFLKARTEMATIQIGLTRAPLAAPPDDLLARAWEELRVAFREGWLAAFRITAIVAILAAQMSPLGVLVIAAWTVYRRWGRRRPVTPSTTGADAGPV